MPYSDIGQGLMAAGGAFSDAIRERRLRREQEEEKRKQELLAMLQRQSMAKVLGPGNEDLLDAGLEPATALAEKKRREDEKKSEMGRQDREKALRDAYIGGRPDPVPPDVESQIQLGAQETDPNQVMNLMNKLSRNQPTPDVAGNATMFGVDQNQLAALVGQGMSVPDAVTKLKSWQEKPSTDQQARIEDQKREQRRKVWIAKGGDPDSVEGRLYIFGLASPEKVDAMSVESATNKYTDMVGDPFKQSALNEIYLERNPGSTSDSLATLPMYMENLRSKGVPINDESKVVPKRTPTPEEVEEWYSGTQGDPLSKYNGITPQEFYDKVVSDSVVANSWSKEQKDKLKELLKIQ